MGHRSVLRDDGVSRDWGVARFKLVFRCCAELDYDVGDSLVRLCENLVGRLTPVVHCFHPRAGNRSGRRYIFNRTVIATSAKASEDGELSRAPEPGLRAFWQW
ncbi:hypothetical protein [Allorhodopirellula heiligendammensis]|nr:hypothetical protein [Allorhodopirellula heiligendammensis]